MSRPDAYFREIRPTVALAFPIIVGQVSQMLMGVTDSVMIGHAGTVPLAASSFGGNVFALFFVLGIGMMMPVSIFVSRARGATRLDEASEYLRHGVALSFIVGAIETAVLVLIGLQLQRFGQPPEVLAIVKPFFFLIGVSITPVLLYLALRQYAESMGRPWLPMYIMLAGVGLNILLNWIFIYGRLGVPALGLTGAGISTFISRTLGALVIFAWLRLDPVTRSAWPKHWFAPLSGARFREMLHIGLPASGMLFFESSAFTFATVMIGWLGAVPLAAHQIALTCASVAYMFPLGLSMAAGMRVSHAVGAGERDRLRPIGFSAAGLSLVMTGTFTIVFAFGSHAVASWFVKDAAVISLAASLLVIAALFQLFDGCQVTVSSSLRAIADVRVPTIITFVAYWGVAIPLGYLLGVRGPFGAIGMWSGIAAGLAFAAVILVSRFGRLTR